MKIAPRVTSIVTQVRMVLIKFVSLITSQGKLKVYFLSKFLLITPSHMKRTISSGIHGGQTRILVNILLLSDYYLITST